MSQSRSHQFKHAMFVAVVMMAIAASANADWFFQGTVSGGVYDIDTNQPIQGAYVLAEDMGAGGVMFAQSSTWCVSTRGMYTGADGLYSFTYKHRGMAPLIHVIKPDYFFVGWRPDNPKFERPGDGSSTLGDHQNLYLRRQDPAKPEWLNSVNCERPTTRSDIEANLIYLNIFMNERIKLGTSKKSIENLQGMVDSLIAKPDSASHQVNE